VISDLEAIKAIDRLCRAAPRNLDLEALRVWIAAHCGLNPHAAGPLLMPANESLHFLQPHSDICGFANRTASRPREFSSI
jgi:hypothetical protein